MVNRRFSCPTGLDRSSYGTKNNLVLTRNRQPETHLRSQSAKHDKKWFIPPGLKYYKSRTETFLHSLIHRPNLSGGINRKRIIQQADLVHVLDLVFDKHHALNLRVIEWYQHRQNCLVFASNMTDFSVNYLRNHSEQRSIFYFEYLGKVWISKTLKRHFIPRRLLRIKHWHLVSSVRCLGVISEHQVRVRVWRPKPEAQNTSFPNSQCVGRSVGRSVGFHEERGLVKGEISENLWVRGKMGHFCFSLCKNS